MSSINKWFERAEYAAQVSKYQVAENATPIYIATTLSNKAAAEALATQLKEQGTHYVTYAWWLVGAVPKTAEIYSAIAEKEMAGVMRCHTFIGLLPGRLGMQSELGAAIASYKRVILYAESEEMFWEYEGQHGNIFWHHPRVTRITGPTPIIALQEHWKALQLL